MSDKGPGKLYFERIDLKSMDNYLDKESESILKTTPITKPIEEAVCFSIYLEKFCIHSQFYTYLGTKIVRITTIKILGNKSIELSLCGWS